MSPTRKAEVGDTSGQHILEYPHGLFSSSEKESAFCPNPALLIARRTALVPSLGRITASSGEGKALSAHTHTHTHTRSHTHTHPREWMNPGWAGLANETDLPEPWRRSQGPKSHRFAQNCCRLLLCSCPAAARQAGGEGWGGRVGGEDDLGGWFGEAWLLLV